MAEILSNLTTVWTDPWLLFLTAIGTLAGIYVGAIPGLSVTMATSILISFTFKWPVNDALALITGVFMGGVYGGSRTAFLLNIPGAPSAVATAIDQLDVAVIRQKVNRIVPKLCDVKRYLGLALRSSSIGTIIGALPGTGGDIAALVAPIFQC